MTTDQLRTRIRRLTNTTVNDYSDADLIADVNSEAAVVHIAILRDRGVLEHDDSNYTDLPIATFPVTAGTATYKITQDDDANFILTKHKITLLNNGKRIDIPRVTIAEGQQVALEGTETGFPTCYYEVGKSIVFSPTPSTSTTGQVWFDRELDQLLTSDTTKELGIPKAYHPLVCFRVAYGYAMEQMLPNENSLLRRITMEEDKLTQYEENRRGDEQRIMSVDVIGDR
jgi:hypothetical protein